MSIKFIRSLDHEQKLRAARETQNQEKSTVIWKEMVKMFEFVLTTLYLGGSRLDL